MRDAPTETGERSASHRLVSSNSSDGAHWLPTSFAPSSSVDVPTTLRGFEAVKGHGSTGEAHDWLKQQQEGTRPLRIIIRDSIPKAGSLAAGRGWTFNDVGSHERASLIGIRGPRSSPR